ncbi:cytoskeletal protein RodZ [Oikeobacillus pervagus]|uniref:Cytoskeletal protein RodZ n=1 Tax=Oikeobacillus pervagus TaxID=1325931 RepID=A0AAJ1T4D9_9BACI|nr:hypothetical protein [Oikeobacillus pervagus]MDQ0216547.1 cytoskeletal protein RodZ [Oikeobacillus pervagus]
MKAKIVTCVTIFIILFVGAWWFDSYFGQKFETEINLEIQPLSTDLLIDQEDHAIPFQPRQYIRIEDIQI